MGLKKYLTELVVENRIVSRGDAAVQGDLSVDGGASVEGVPSNSTDITRKTDLDSTEAALSSDIDGVDSDLQNHKGDTGNPHNTSASQVGAPTQDEFDDHSARHSQGSADEVRAEDLGAASQNAELFFGPDGAGGVEAKEASGGALDEEMALVYSGL